jgi:TatD DNase family protein
MEFFNLHTHKWTNQPECAGIGESISQNLMQQFRIILSGFIRGFIVEERIEADLAIMESKLQRANVSLLAECSWTNA